MQTLHTVTRKTKVEPPKNSGQYIVNAELFPWNSEGTLLNYKIICVMDKNPKYGPSSKKASPYVVRHPVGVAMFFQRNLLEEACLPSAKDVLSCLQHGLKGISGKRLHFDHIIYHSKF